MATIRPYDPAHLGRVPALDVDAEEALQVVAGFAADVREFARD